MGSGGSRIWKGGGGLYPPEILKWFQMVVGGGRGSSEGGVQANPSKFTIDGQAAYVDIQMAFLWRITTHTYVHGMCVTYDDYLY